MERKELFAEIAELAKFAYDDSDEDDVQSWDAYESAKAMIVLMQKHGYDITYMLEQIAEDAEDEDNAE
jgi:hypothetical protein